MLWIVSIFQWEFFMVGINLITGLQPLLGTPEGTEMGCIIFFYKFDYDGLLVVVVV